MEEIQRYECLYNKFSKDYKNRRTRENAWETIGQKFGLTAEEAEKKYRNIHTSYTRHLKKVKSVPSGSGRDCAKDWRVCKPYYLVRVFERFQDVLSSGISAEPKTDAIFDVLSFSSSLQNITEKQITRQKSSSSIDCRHFNFDLVGKKIPSASLFYRLIRYKRFKFITTPVSTEIFTYLLYKLECHVRITTTEKDRIAAREKLRYFFTCV